jgi:energy-coupling factor transport system ATP-binding protein
LTKEKEVIRIEDLWHIYRGGVEALRGVSITVFEGDFIALIGQNGSGKTTLAKHLNGLLKPTKGSVYVKGIDTRDYSLGRLSSMVGYVFQNPDHMLFANTVEEEVAAGPKNLKLPDDEIKQRVDLALKTVGLEEERKESPFFFGKGMRRKITLAAMLSMKPEILVIDEPTTGMDYRGSEEVMKLITKVHDEGHTIIIIAHDMRMVADYAKRTVVMFEGKVLLDSPTNECFTQIENLEKAFLRPPQITRLAQKLKEYGIPPNVLSVDELSKILKRKLT